MLLVSLSFWIADEHPRTGTWESELTFPALAVHGQCTTYPIPRAIWAGRETLEIDAEVPSDNGTDIVSPVAVEYIATDLYIGGTNATGPP